MNDPILDELHRDRREHAREFHDDLKALLADLRQRGQQSPEPHRSEPLKPRRITIPVSTTAH